MSYTINMNVPAICVIVLCALVGRTDAHGRLIDPPSRSSMWRFGFKTPINYDDNQLFCGGYDTQWHVNGGRCGVCGDPFNGRRENEAGGRYATGTIAKRYVEGQTIPITIDVTTNHGGYIEFRICPNNNPSRPVTEACLNQNLLRQPDGNTRWRLPTGTRQFTMNMVLPRKLVCSQCVLQWKWNTASNWDCDANNTCCKGCGPQEQFMGCADVSISPSTFTSGTNNQPSGTIDNTGSASNLGSILVGSNPLGNQGFVPIDGLMSGTNEGFTSCKAVPAWKARYLYADQWCQAQCQAGNCPALYCQNGCRILYG